MLSLPSLFPLWNAITKREVGVTVVVQYSGESLLNVSYTNITSDHSKRICAVNVEWNNHTSLYNMPYESGSNLYVLFI